MWKSIVLTAIVGAVTAFTAPTKSDAAGVYVGSRGVAVTTGRPYGGYGYGYGSPYYGYGYSSPYYGGYSYGYPAYGYGYSYPAYGYGYGGYYGSYGYPYYGGSGVVIGNRGGIVYGPNGAVGWR